MKTRVQVGHNFERMMPQSRAIEGSTPAGAKKPRRDGWGRKWNRDVDKPLAVIAVRRRVASLADGANVYLSVLLEELRDANFATALVFAPESSFGDLPAAATASGILAKCDHVQWSRVHKVGRFAVSLSPRVWGRFARRLVREVCGLFGRPTRKLPSRPSQPLPEAEAHRLAAEIDALAPRLVIAEYSALGPMLAHLRTPGGVRAILLHDLFSLRTEALRRQAAAADVAAVSLEEEAAACAPAELLIYASETERRTFMPLLPGRTHVWMAPKRPALSRKEPDAVAEAPAAAFVGVCHRGNLDALDYLMTEIWPTAAAAAPGAELRIVGEIGTAMRPEWRRLPGVRVMGVVKDLRTIGGPHVIGLAPARVASGVSIKIADYMSLGMPILASAAAIEGYGARLDGAIEVANGAAAFARSLSLLLTSPEQCQALSDRARRAALRDEDNENLGRELRRIAEFALRG